MNNLVGTRCEQRTTPWQHHRVSDDPVAIMQGLSAYRHSSTLSADVFARYNRTLNVPTLYVSLRLCHVAHSISDIHCRFAEPMSMEPLPRRRYRTLTFGNPISLTTPGLRRGCHPIRTLYQIPQITYGDLRVRVS